MCRPKTSQVSRKSYCQYLLSTQINYTLTNYAEHMEKVTHDAINRYLCEDKLPPKLVWEHAREHINYSNNGYIVFDDSILDKNYSKSIESVRWQYSGNAHKIIRGIGLVNCVYINPETNEYWVIDYRVFDPESDGKGKMGAPSKAHRYQLVKIQPTQRLTTSVEQGSALEEVTNLMTPERRMYQAATQVNVLSSEIFNIVEVDALHCDGRQHC